MTSTVAYAMSATTSRYAIAHRLEPGALAAILFRTPGPTNIKSAKSWANPRIDRPWSDGL